MSSALEFHRGDWVVSTDRARLDVDLIHQFLTHSYWAEGIGREVVERSLENSLCFGIFERGQQIGFARVITDYATYAYLADVFIIDTHRSRGAAKFLMECILRYPQLENLRRWMLATRDAHRLYARFGFTPLAEPERFMELHNPRVYAKGSR
ncbi:MAG: GNAT family N-acetyltransferase [Acidobacteria bacterium]|nr:GNAT family N-acetyltransferase [Acidobacteriota bacterium]